MPRIITNPIGSERRMIVHGNAAEQGAGHRGWFVGDFIAGPLYSRDVEVKWGVHAAGEERAEWTAPAESESLSILVRGRFVVVFEDRECVLAKEGDFVFWGTGVRHTSRAAEDSVVVTVRWRKGG